MVLYTFFRRKIYNISWEDCLIENKLLYIFNNNIKHTPFYMFNVNKELSDTVKYIAYNHMVICLKYNIGVKKAKKLYQYFNSNFITLYHLNLLNSELQYIEQYLMANHGSFFDNRLKKAMVYYRRLF